MHNDKEEIITSSVNMKQRSYSSSWGRFL